MPENALSPKVLNLKSPFGTNGVSFVGIINSPSFVKPSLIDIFSNSSLSNVLNLPM